MIRLPLLILTFVVVNLAACSPRVEHSDIVGVYQLAYPFGVERLQLRADGSYVQSLTLRGQTTSISHSGAWEYAAPRRLVTVHDPLQFGDYFGELNPSYLIPVKGTWNLTVEKTFGDVSLTWKDKLSVKFEKLK